jgi:hypothetical protein
MSETSKRCSRCGIEKPAHDFALRGNALHSWCKQCAKEYSSAYYQNNRERIDSLKRLWNERNIEKVRADQRIWKADNIDRVRELSRKSDRKRYWENPDKVRAKKLSQYYSEKEKWLARAAAKPHHVKKAGWRIHELTRSGRLIRPDSCASCRATGVPIELHHPNHRAPEVVVGLCRKCHGATRRKEQTA